MCTCGSDSWQLWSSVLWFCCACTLSAFIYWKKKKEYTHRQVQTACWPLEKYKTRFQYKVLQVVGRPHPHTQPLLVDFKPAQRETKGWDLNRRERIKRNKGFTKWKHEGRERERERMMCHSSSKDSNIWIVIWCCITVSGSFLCENILIHIWTIICKTWT